MKAFFVLFILLLHHSVFAQNKPFYNGSFTSIGRPIIIGDTDLIGTYHAPHISGSGCKVWVGMLFCCKYYPGINFQWNYPTEDGSGRGNIYWAPMSVGTATDTNLMDVFGESVSSACFGFNGTCQIVAKATSRDDSLVLLRPRAWTLDLRPDSSTHGWMGFARPFLTNKTEKNVTFKNWTIECSSLNQPIEVQVYDNSLRIDSLQWAAHAGKKFIQYKVYTGRGPITDTLIYPATIHVHVVGGGVDSTYTQSVDLRFLPTNWSNYSSLSNDSLVFSAAPLYTETQKIVFIPDSRCERIYTDPISYPFSLGVDSTLGKITYYVTANARTGGIYDEELVIRTAIRDFNNDIREDSFAVRLQLSAPVNNDPSSWSRLSLDSSNVRQLLISPNNTLWVNQGNVVFSKNEGDYWRRTPFVNNVLQIAAGRENTLLVISNPRAVLRYDPTKGFRIDTLKNSPCESYYYSGVSYCERTQPLGITSNDSVVWVTTNLSRYDRFLRQIVIENSTFISKNNGDSWNKIAYSGGASITVDSFNSPILSRDNDLMISPIQYGGKFWHSPDSISAIGISPENEYYVGTKSRGIYRSDSKSNNWVKTSLLLQNIRSIACAPNGDVYVAAYGRGLFKSKDKGKTWEGVNDGLPTNKLTTLAINDSGKVFVGTEDFGAYRSIPILPSVTERDHPIVASYPNPWSDRTTLEFILDKGEDVEVTVFDLLGNKVDQKEFKGLKAGKHKVSLASTILSPGVYFCMLHFGDRTEVLKLVKE